MSPKSATYHYADERSLATLCGLRLGGPLKVLGSGRSRQEREAPALVIDFAVSEGGRICEKCSAALVGTGGWAKKIFSLPGLLVAVGIATVLSLIFLQSGNQDQHAGTATTVSFSLSGFTNGRWLEQQDGRLASSIKELEWTKDGVDGTESKAIQGLIYIAATSRSVASSLVALRWVEDGVNDVEAEAISWLSNTRRAGVASAVVSLDWLGDGIDETEVKAIEYLSYIANKDFATSKSLVSLDWMQDDIGSLEADTIRWISNFASPSIAASVVGLSWVGDGITGLESQLIEELSYLSNGHLVHAMKIVDMPFLESVEPPDLSAVRALSDLCSFRPRECEGVVSHPAVRDGITDDMVPIVATLKGVAQTNPELIRALLDPSRVFLERRIIRLQLSGDVILDIVRTAQGAARSMDLLELSVRGAEEFMGVPFPTGHVVLLYENAVHGSNVGANSGTHIAIRPEFDVDDGSNEASFAGRSKAHEVAHYYWSGNADWVDEGAAEFMASAIDGMRTGQPIGIIHAPCGYARSIAELETLRVSRGDLEFECNYSLGERLFVDLYRVLGDDRFRQGFRELYATSAIEDDADDIRGTSVGIDDVRRAFGSDDGRVNSIIARWYAGTVSFNPTRLDPSAVDPRLSGIDGRIEQAFVNTSTGGPAVSVFSAEDIDDWVYLTLEYSYSLSSGKQEVPVEIVEYFEDGFEFSRRSYSLGAEAGYTGGTAWFSVGQSPPLKWAPGRYLVYVYSGDRKVAEVEYEVTP